MRIRFVFSACVAATAMHTALAQGPITDPSPAFRSDRSKADVRAEYGEFKRSAANPWATSYSQVNGFKSERSRAEVRSDYLANRGLVEAFTGEDSGSEALRRARTG